MEERQKLDIEVADIRKVGPFTYRWPGGDDDVETYERVWEAKVRVDERTMDARHGLGRRESYGRDRVRGVTWLGGQPVVEGAEADDYSATRDLISIVKLPGGTQANAPGELPPEYSEFNVVVHGQAIQGPRKSNAVALRIKEDDVNAWARYAAIRRALKEQHSAQLPEPSASSEDVWCIYVPQSASTNFALALQEGIWGTEEESFFQGLHEGDLVLFVEALQPDQEPLARSFPRVALSDFKGIAVAIVEGTVTAPSYADRATLWPDRPYPFRFRFDQRRLSRQTPFSTTTFPAAIVDGVRRSALTRGKPVLAKASAARPRGIWIEKTLVRGRPDRQSGELALGRALWSPRADQRGGDTYRFMRDVSAGDLVLHLTDNEAFTGTSFAAAPFREGDGVPGTAWPGDAYIVDLESYSPLDPQLTRHDLFDGASASALQSLVESGVRNLFFNRNLELNQGAYLTPVPAALAAILNAAYQAKAGRDLITMADSPPVTELVEATSLASRFSEHIAASNLTFGLDQETLLRSFLASLITKPLVILTGLSGSGKTQLAIKFGEWLGDGHYLVEAVRPDWTGSEALFGYEDAFKATSDADGRRAWTAPRPLQFMLTASRDKARPYLLILDEMNLAHVERYFADFLSGAESHEAVLPNLIHEADGEWRIPASGPERIAVPDNLFVVGTVNIDETTYMFSPKVLDRANTFEFRVKTEDLSAPIREPVKALGASDAVRQSILAVARDRSATPATKQQGGLFGKKLIELHALLSRGGFEFGYRVFYEALRFTGNFELMGGDEMTALDLQVLQKVLPRLHGSRRKLEPLLLGVGRFCYELADPGEESSSENFDAWFGLQGPPPTQPELPRSFDKVRRMLWNLRANQFVSFTE